jgi:hypothetical protein
VARLERRGSNPTTATLERALDATGHGLELVARPKPSVDETLIARQLRLTPTERLAAFERAYSDVRDLALAARRSRGELA